MVTAGSSAGPTRTRRTASARPSTTLSCKASGTTTLVNRPQPWPAIVTNRITAAIRDGTSASGNAKSADLPPNSSRVCLKVAAADCGDGASHRRRSGECHHVDPRIGHHELTDVGSAGDHVEHARRNSGLDGELAEQQRATRGLGCGFEDHGVAGDQGGRHLPQVQKVRRVPWRDGGDHSPRLTYDTLAGARRTGQLGQLITQLGAALVHHVAVVVHRPANLAEFGHSATRSHLGLHEMGEVRRVRLDEIGKAQKDLGTLRRGQPGPLPVVERSSGGGDCGIGLASVRPAARCGRARRLTD